MSQLKVSLDEGILQQEHTTVKNLTVTNGLPNTEVSLPRSFTVVCVAFKKITQLPYLS